MDIMTGVGLACGLGVITLIMLMGGSLEMFWSEHAIIIHCVVFMAVSFPDR